MVLSVILHDICKYLQYYPESTNTYMELTVMLYDINTSNNTNINTIHNLLIPTKY